MKLLKVDFAKEFEARGLPLEDGRVETELGLSLFCLMVIYI